MVLRKLLCRPKSAKRLQAPKAGHTSLSPDAKEVLDKQVSWLNEEKSKLNDAEAHDFEEKFMQVIHGEGDSSSNDQMVSREQLEKVFESMGVFFEPELFEKVYRLFDADGDGKVNKAEFTVTMCFLMYRGSAHDKTELCFRLFDTNRDNGISRREFNDMIASIIGNRLVNVLTVDKGREAFSAYLKKEFADELLQFLDAVAYLASPDARGSTFSVEQAKEIFAQFLEVDAESQINVSDAVRERCRALMQAAADDGAVDVPVTIFDDAAEEAVVLLEAGPLPRFKSKIRTTYAFFADPAWAEYALEPTAGMTLEVFRAWSEKTPGLFNFFDALQDVLELSTMRWGPKGAPPLSPDSPEQVAAVDAKAA